MFSNAKKCGEGQVSGMSEGQEELLRMEGVIEHVIYENPVSYTHLTLPTIRLV